MGRGDGLCFSQEYSYNYTRFNAYTQASLPAYTLIYNTVPVLLTQLTAEEGKYTPGSSKYVNSKWNPSYVIEVKIFHSFSNFS